MRVSSRCYAITGLAYMPPWCVNSGFITGDHVTLVVDTGANALAAQTVHGYATAARPSNFLRVINTEKHFDHIGGNGFFRERGIDVWGHFDIARTQVEFEAEMAEFDGVIADPTRRAAHESAAFYEGTEVENPNCAITEDFRMDLGGMAAQIILTPGHTSTNLSVWVEEDRVLYTGDCLIRSYAPNLEAAGGPDGWRTWLASLDGIEALRPEIVVAGHGAVMRGREITEAIDTVRSVLNDRLSGTLNA